MKKSTALAAVFLFAASISHAGNAPANHQGFNEKDCTNCHQAYARAFLSAGSEASANHQGFECTVCHDSHSTGGNLALIPDVITTPNSGPRTVIFTSYTGPNSFADGDSIYDGVCEVCHTTTTYHRNATSGLHNHNPGTDCTACHTHESGFTPSGGSCMDCHNKTQPYMAGDYRRQIVENAGDGQGDFVNLTHHVDDGSGTESVTNSDCTVCHDQSQHQSFKNGVSVLLRDQAGGPSILYDGTPQSLEPFCLGCHDGTQTAPFSDGKPAPDHSAWDGSQHSPAGITCAQCHNNGHGTGNLAMIGTSIDTPNSGTRSVVLTNLTGQNSFADGDATYDGICEVCHTTTLHHRNDPSGDHAHNAGADCRSCHDHDSGHQPVAGSCLDCHKSPQGPGDYRRQVVENAGDGGGDFVRASHHVTDGTTTEVVTETDCTVCHDQSQHQSFGDGVSVLLNNPAGGASILYNGTTSSLTGFCKACHDGSATSAPFSDGNVPPNKLSTWNQSAHNLQAVQCADCHGNGHGGDRAEMLQDRYDMADNNQYADAAYALCWHCHDPAVIVFGTNSFKGLHKRHVQNVQTPCRTCHDTHGGFDSGEAGMIDFTWAINNGFDIQFIGGKDASSSFWISGTQGYCYIRCHGMDHKPKKYDRSQGGTSEDGSGGKDSFGKIFASAKAFPSPTQGPVTVELKANEKIDPQEAEPLDVSVTIYDVTGRKLRELHYMHGGTGDLTLYWDGLDNQGRRVNSGIYLCKIATKYGSKTVKLVVVR